MSSKIVIFTAPSITTKLGKLHATRGETFQSSHCCQHQVPTQGNVQIHSKAIVASNMNVLCGGNHDPKFPMGIYV